MDKREIVKELLRKARDTHNAKFIDDSEVLELENYCGVYPMNIQTICEDYLEMEEQLEQLKDAASDWLMDTREENDHHPEWQVLAETIDNINLTRKRKLK